MSDISTDINIGDSDDRISIPTESHDLNLWTSSDFKIGINYRIHFFKFLTIGCGAEYVYPWQVSKIDFKSKKAYSNKVFANSIKKLKGKLNSPYFQLTIFLGIAI